VIKSVMMGYYWTQHKKLTKALMTREEIPLFMKSLQPRLQAYQKLHEVGVYPPVAGQHCFYCPVASCKFNKNKKLKAG
jgi:hypothetical protein